MCVFPVVIKSMEANEMTERGVPTQRVPTQEEVESSLRDHRNWGRWGDKGSAGAVNLITAEKRVSAAALVKTGRTVSLGRPVSVKPSIDNPTPAQHYMTTLDESAGGPAAEDYYGSYYHGVIETHIDALCHMWDQDGGWDGRDPDEILTFTGALYGAVDAWSDGILTRGVLLDVPKHRGKPYVTLEEPVHGWELEDVAKEEGLTLEPGDAVMVYSGRDAYARDHGGAWWGMGREGRPGLHASCLPFIRDSDMAVLGMDMMDASHPEYTIPHTVHAAIFAYGVVLLDNALLEPLAAACAEEGRYEFMVTINPLKLIGGTGSPVNPTAVL